MLYLLIIMTTLLIFLIYPIERDIISPAFIFSGVFLVAEINVLTNVNMLNVKLSIDTFGIVFGGCCVFFVAAVISNYLCKKIKIIHSTQNREISLADKKMRMLLIFNLVSIVLILREVYILTIQRAGYSGNILGALSVYAEVSKFQSVDVSLSTASTLLSAVCEAEGYTLGYIIADNMARKKKISKITIMCFITAFLSTFCQGSRGGVFMLIVAIFSYILVYREMHRTKNIGTKIIIRMLLIVCAAIAVFQLLGVITGKMWNVSFYEYLSVYLGDPLINLNTKLQEGIQRSTVMGQVSFPALINKIYALSGGNLPVYHGLSSFQYYEKHNLGNVYTIYASLIADYGMAGMVVAVFIIGFSMEMLYIMAKKSKSQVSLERIIWGYMSTGVAFSFFSNKICENISVFRIYTFVFMWMLIQYVFTKKAG